MMDLIIFIFVVILILVLASIIVRQQFKLRKASTLLVQKIFDEGVLQDQLMKIRSEKALEQNEDFVKFISESRDWAFKYIEDVQQTIQELKDAVESGYPTEEKLTKLFSLLPENKEK